MLYYIPWGGLSQGEYCIDIIRSACETSASYDIH